MRTTRTNPKVYVASKLHHAEMVKQLILDHPYITFTNRWQFFEGEIPDTEIHALNFWENDFDDVDAAEWVLAYGVGDDTLKGALVEVGYGIGKGKRIIKCGDCNSYGTWQFSRRVEKYNGTLEGSLKYIHGKHHAI